VDIGGVDELPLWRIFMDMLNKRIETKTEMNKEEQKMVGPLMWQPIHEQM
jgi:hypothetical protein